MLMKCIMAFELIAFDKVYVNGIKQLYFLDDTHFTFQFNDSSQPISMHELFDLFIKLIFLG